jgi:hypothetical protein
VPEVINQIVSAALPPKQLIRFFDVSIKKEQ